MFKLSSITDFMHLKVQHLSIIYLKKNVMLFFNRKKIKPILLKEVTEIRNRRY